MAHIIPKDSDQTPENLVIGLNLKEPGDVPWIRIECLYASITETGDASWEQVIDVEYAKGSRKFTVLSGRHGGMFGSPVNTGTGAYVYKIADSEHLKEDSKQAAKVRQKYPDVEIEIVDAAVLAPDRNKVKALMTLAKAKLSADRVVILAWCYSLYSLLEYPEHLLELTADGKYQKYLRVLKSYTTEQPIWALVNQYFYWVPIRPN